VGGRGAALSEKKTFTYEEASKLLPEVQRLTSEAVAECEDLSESEAAEAQRILTQWAQSILALGVEVKGLWLVDFDCGVGYYCWRYPEPSLQFFHGYEEGFGGRVPMV
jgi:hypothetical protein